MSFLYICMVVQFKSVQISTPGRACALNAIYSSILSRSTIRMVGSTDYTNHKVTRSLKCVVFAVQFSYLPLAWKTANRIATWSLWHVEKDIVLELAMGFVISQNFVCCGNLLVLHQIECRDFLDVLEKIQHFLSSRDVIRWRRLQRTRRVTVAVERCLRAFGVGFGVQISVGFYCVASDPFGETFRESCLKII